MQQRGTAVILLALAAFASVDGKKVGTQGKGTPVESVITLLEKLQKQIAKEGQEEAASYDKFACFCKEQADEKFYLINKAKKKMKLLEAEIETLEGEIEELDAQTAEAKKEKQGLDEEIEADKKARQEALEAFLKADESKAELLDALDRAIAALEEAKAKQVNAKTMLTEKYATPIVRHLLASGDLHSLNEEQLGQVFAFLETAVPDKAFQLPAMVQEATQQQPHAYEYKSNDIISLLKEMRKSITDEKREAVSAQEDKHNSDMMVNGKENQVEVLDELIAKNEEISAAKSDAKSGKEQDFEETEKDMGHDQEFLDELTDQCETKAELFDQRSKTRSDELTAIAGALEELKGTVSGKYQANKKLVGLAAKKNDVKKADNAKKKAEDQLTKDIVAEATDEAEDVSFLQRRDPHAAARRKIMQLLRSKASSLKSGEIGTLLLKLKADHFVKVRGLINDLIKRLEEEAKAEAEQKAFCDEELEKAITKRDDNQIEIEKNNADITKANAKVDQLTEDIGELSTDIAELNKAKKEAEEIRSEEKKTNEYTIEEATAGLAAVKRAIQLLKEFYENAFIQKYDPFRAEGAAADGKTVGDIAPDAGFDDEYHGNQAASKGIIGLLEVIQSDFERTIKTTEDEEAEAAEEHEGFIKETDGTIDEKEGTKDEKTGEKKDTEATIVEKKDDRADAKTMKGEALEELEKLKPQCIDTGLSWEERTKKREQEIEALKEALQILDTAFD